MKDSKLNGCSDNPPCIGNGVDPGCSWLKPTALAELAAPVDGMSYSCKRVPGARLVRTTSGVLALTHGSGKVRLLDPNALRRVIARHADGMPVDVNAANMRHEMSFGASST